MPTAPKPGEGWTPTPDGQGWLPPGYAQQTGTGGSGSTSTQFSTLNYVPTPAPAFNAPAFGAAPAWNKPAEFSYGDFVAPDKQAVYQDPGYQFRLNQGQEALDRSAAARGSLRGGAQQRALMAYGSDLASAEYQNAFNRAQSAYDRNYAKARDAYGLNYQTGLDTYRIGAGERDSQFNAGMQRAQAEYAPQLQTWQAQNLQGSYNATAAYEREWDKYRYDTDENYRRWRDQQDQAYRNMAYSGDDAFRNYQLEENRRLRLLELGAT